MITTIRGQVQEVLPDGIILEVGGVGLQVFMPEPALDQLYAGEKVFLHTYLAVREDALILYGFPTKEEREYFVLLISVNGVGPRLALTMLSTLTPDAMRRAIFHEQAEVFVRVPGIGNKTAQKILFHLQDRIPLEAGMEFAGGVGEFDSEVLSALTALGYSVVEAQAAIQSIPRDAPEDVETRLRIALQYFG
jgi:Holliday junction DNA helicase RuvA